MVIDGQEDTHCVRFFYAIEGHRWSGRHTVYAFLRCLPRKSTTCARGAFPMPAPSQERHASGVAEWHASQVVEGREGQ